MYKNFLLKCEVEDLKYEIWKEIKYKKYKCLISNTGLEQESKL
jgi:hypothetical protein